MVKQHIFGGGRMIEVTPDIDEQAIMQGQAEAAGEAGPVGAVGADRP
jgi:hypothetical protein